MDFRRQVEAAAERIRPYVRETPVEFSPHLSDAGNCRVHLKLENLQRTGSFKLKTPAGERSFMIKRSTLLSDFDTFIAPFRGKGGG